jgi:hypothetical protein
MLYSTRNKCISSVSRRGGHGVGTRLRGVLEIATVNRIELYALRGTEIMFRGALTRSAHARDSSCFADSASLTQSSRDVTPRRAFPASPLRWTHLIPPEGRLGHVVCVVGGSLPAATAALCRHYMIKNACHEYLLPGARWSVKDRFFIRAASVYLPSNWHLGPVISQVCWQQRTLFMNCQSVL